MTKYLVMTKSPRSSFDNWTVQVRKGLIELCVLNALSGPERHGYELVRALVDMPGLGATEGTIYPLLSRLRLQGLVTTRLVESSSGPVRKFPTSRVGDCELRTVCFWPLIGAGFVVRGVSTLTGARLKNG